ncbi:MAG: ABC transporter substrate-binding protein [Polaromonas sp.]|uniref:ABC transporter substrate-binding protein n=1 Tax=Polaromonas sp. TaxID=1869339 RepID=UPI00273493CB|nr:ABC transporter substrate-binding protein [Polaromonas sp.]MDP2817573.1 ABC transporter substrate-binding protein [Polaromonas sp.]
MFFAGISHAQKAWVVGQSVPLSGGNASFGRDIQAGAQAYFKSVNAKGGVGGLPIELVSLDDKNDRKLAGANTQKLLGTNDAVALFGFASATLSLDAMPQAEKAGVLFFAPFSGANPVRKASPVVFTLRASYGDELEKMLAFWTGLGFKQVVVVHYDDEVGKQNLAVVTDYLARQDKKPAAFALQRNTKVSEVQVSQLLKLKPDVIINTVLSGPASEISKQIVAQGKFIPTSSLSFVGAQQYIEAAAEAGAGVSISQVVPNAASSLPVVKECAKALKDAGVNQAMNSTHLESCIGAKVLTEAMRRSKKPGDAKALLAAMGSLGSYDAGGFTVTYTANQHHGSKYVELGMVTRDGKLRN